MEERLEPISPMSPTIAALTMSSSGVASTSSDIGMRPGNQPIAVDADPDIKMRPGDQPVEVSEGPDMDARANNQPIEVNADPNVEPRAGGHPIEEVPSSLQGVDEVPPSVEPDQGARGLLLELASILVDAVGQHGEASAIMEIPSMMVDGSTKMAVGKQSL